MSDTAVVPRSKPADVLLRAYLDATYRIQTGNGELTLSAGQRSPIETPLAGCVHAILTACNPGSAALCDDENTRRQTQLVQALAEHCLTWEPAENHAADGSWREPACWIPHIQPNLLDQLADRFGQNASLIIDDDGICRLRIHHAGWIQRDDRDTRVQWPT